MPGAVMRTSTVAPMPTTRPRLRLFLGRMLSAFADPPLTVSFLVVNGQALRVGALQRSSTAPPAGTSLMRSLVNRVDLLEAAPDVETPATIFENGAALPSQFSS